MSRVHVVLVPGFFGFANLGDLAYFGHVHAFLSEAYAARHWAPVLHVVRTFPTASTAACSWRPASCCRRRTTSRRSRAA
jgi:hypothetical protein